jgi:hypothetical protein
MKIDKSILLISLAFVIQGIGSGQNVIRMDFESVPDFSLTFDTWKVRDIDSAETYYITGYTFPHNGQPIGFIAFNPSQVTPPMTDPFIQPFSGQRFGACISATTPPNNDWFISPQIQLGKGGSFTFRVKSYTADYGLEKYKVGVSTTTNNPSAFTFLTGSSPLLADTVWTKKTFSLSAYDDQQVYVAIQCVSDTAFVFMIDDLEIRTESDTTGGLPSSLALDFENLDDFTLDFNPWTVKDVNGGVTYVITNCVFPHNGSPMAYINFNPAKATPPPMHMTAHSGEKFGACFSSEPPHNPNNKWLITPKMQLENNSRISFWIESYNIAYGYEKFNVGVSTTGNDPSDFTIISGAKPDSAPINWVRKVYNLADYANQPVYIGIQCVTDTGFCFMIDDIEIGSSVNVNDNMQDETVKIYPNPARDKLYIDIGKLEPGNVRIEIYDMMGNVVKKYNREKKNAGTLVANISGLNPGLYLVKIFGSHENFVEKLLVK